VKPTALGTTWRTVLFKERPGGMAYSLYANNVVAGIYGDGGGHPGGLLAGGTIGAPTVGAWNTIAVPATAVAAGTTYWIALLAPGGTFVFRDRCCNVAGMSPTETNAQTGPAALPAHWTTGTVYDDAPMSAYASG
jgi:hypothetical protein